MFQQIPSMSFRSFAIFVRCSRQTLKQTWRTMFASATTTVPAFAHAVAIWPFSSARAINFCTLYGNSQLMAKKAIEHQPACYW
jgi:hypothetical protein